ncbi:MAG: hypothetical protein AABZ11_06970, partial [Nitrospinota bacterium]
SISNSDMLLLSNNSTSLFSSLKSMSSPFIPLPAECPALHPLRDRMSKAFVIPSGYRFLTGFKAG